MQKRWEGERYWDDLHVECELGVRGKRMTHARSWPYASVLCESAVRTLYSTETVRANQKLEMTGRALLMSPITPRWLSA